MTKPSPGAKGIFVSLGYRDFRLLFVGSFAEHSGEWMERLAMGWLVLELTNSPFILGLVDFCRYLPLLFMAIFGGIVADRGDRRKLLLASLVGFAFLSFSLAILIYTSLVQIWMILLISVLWGVVLSFNHPARSAIVPNVVDRAHLMNAISLDSSVVWISSILAPALAGWLVGALGVAPIFVLRGLGCVLAVWTTLALRVPTRQNNAIQSNFRNNFTESWHYLRRDKVILTLVLLYIVPIVFAGPYALLLPVFARDILDVGASGLGFLYSAGGLGSMFTLVALASLRDFRRKGLLLFISSALTGAFLALFAFSRWFPLSLLLLVTAGAMNTTSIIVDTTLIQTLIPDYLRGRIMSFKEVTRGLAPFGSLMLGSLANLLGAPLALGLMGALGVFLSVGAATSFPKVRRLP